MKSRGILLQFIRLSDFFFFSFNHRNARASSRILAFHKSSTFQSEGKKVDIYRILTSLRIYSTHFPIVWNVQFFIFSHKIKIKMYSIRRRPINS